MSIFDNIKRDRTFWIYVVIVIILIFFGATLLFQDNPASRNQQAAQNVSKVSNEDRTPTEIKTSSYFSQAIVPKNFEVTEDKNGKGTDYKLYSQTIKNHNETMEITIEVIPTNIEKRQNNGIALFETPDDINRLVYLSTIDSKKLYRDDEKDKYFNAGREAARQQPNVYLTSDRKVKFVIYGETGKKDLPYISSFKTINNQEVRITCLIKYDISEDAFYAAIKDFDDIIKSLKI